MSLSLSRVARITIFILAVIAAYSVHIFYASAVHDCDGTVCQEGSWCSGGNCYYDNTCCGVGYFCAYNGEGSFCNDGYCGDDTRCEFYAPTKCADGEDNDCDGATDLSDSNCPNYATDDEGPEPPKCGGACCPPTPPAPSVDILCNSTQGPCTVANGANVTISWSSSDATSCTASNAWSGAKATSGSEVRGPITTTSVFTLTCSGDGGSGQDSVTVQNPPNNPPVTSSVRVTEPNYCASAPSAFVEWAYSDPEGNPQQYYQVQIDDDAGYGSPAIDTGAVACAACRSYLSPATLAFNTTYRARVRTWDDPNRVSPWANMSLCTGSGCQPGNTSWLTPQHAYPSNVDFSWTPTNPSVNQLVQFTNTAVCYALGGSATSCASWAWTFGDGGTSTIQNPTHTYVSEGTFPVTFRVTDAQGYQCPASGPLTKNLSIQKKIPAWKEVAPR